MTEQSSHIRILGGGFGGLYTALRLSQLPWEDGKVPEITLIDQRDRFLFSPLLYELITQELQTWEIAPPYAELLADTNIRFQQARVTGIDLSTKQVKLDRHNPLSYDKLVLALGGKTPLNIVPGVKEYAIPFRSLEDAYRLEQKLRQLENSPTDKIRIVIVGGGYSGVELAAKLADRLQKRGRIRIIERGDSILRNSPQFNQENAKNTLAAKKVWIDLDTAVESVAENSISLMYKGEVDIIPVDIVLWTVGNQVSELVESLPLVKNQAGFLVTNSHLQTQGHEDIFALGDLADCTDVNGQKVPATAQSAFQQSDYCAWNVWASLTHRPLLPFRYQNLGEMMALGQDNATLSGLGMKLDGTFAYLVRRLIYLYRLPTFKHQLAVGFNWMSTPIMDLLQNEK